MRPEQLALMIPIISLIGAFIMVIFLRRYQNIERMSMIERGINPADMKSVWLGKLRDPYRHLRIACTAIGIGLGFLIGSIWQGAFDFHARDTVFLGGVILFGGLGLLAGYIIQIWLQNKAKSQGRYPEDDEV
jgi:hypothetical protein